MLEPSSNALTFYHVENSTMAELAQHQLTLFTLLQQREQEFGFNPQTIVHYPQAQFLTSPVDYLHHFLTDPAQQDEVINQVVILTTRDILETPLLQAGYEREAIHMPAGPENTAIFRQQLNNVPEGKTLYIEAVDEQDPKIRPTFVLILRNEHGEILGGMSGSIWEQGKTRYAYIGTVVVQPQLRAGTGMMLANSVLDYLREQHVYEVNLGTQTAEAFYAQLGFKSIHHIVTALRHRTDKNGQTVPHNLVIMSKHL
ncbi:GNAT family N-acetyltransferase [Yokenella regensburgei]|uniref:GNAT family N-acetyltransferase n=1 Tax=Yokenella regensburgei TaxID=158877 RepID=UPI00143289AE|nr:GNAT family N-acetyltransferase [Yokenella regensburgei]QIU91003.1 GNAT family N-acetyltransferase [Yokenella regensburgei]